ncbi:hypothetical protein [Acidimangrovimonas sediminis]|uniref:hypothetical protein n=1 Tax=Acidimangrovimonas sediminis TaxID=2056283 RepID=UPI000C8015E6|nr:hypothetical protein [Acidimangrovimonas sediminis]
MTGFDLFIAIAVVTAFLARFLPFVRRRSAPAEVRDSVVLRVLGLSSQAMLGALAFELAFGTNAKDRGSAIGPSNVTILVLLALGLILAAQGRKTALIWALALGAYLSLHTVFG